MKSMHPESSGLTIGPGVVVEEMAAESAAAVVRAPLDVRALADFFTAARLQSPGSACSAPGLWYVPQTLHLGGNHAHR